MRQLVAEMQNGALDNQRIEQLMTELAKRLRDRSGKKQYGYLPPAMKSLVDEIVDELAKDPRVAAAYDLWYEQREEVLRTYKDDLPPRISLSRQKEFKRIRNIVIEEAMRLGKYDEVFAPADTMEPDPDTGQEQTTDNLSRLTRTAEAGVDYAQYALGKLYRDGRGVEKDILRAVVWFTQAAEQGNSYAAYALGKLYLTGEDLPRNMEAALRWLRCSAELGNQYAQYRLGKLLLSGDSVAKDVENAMRVTVDSKLRRKIREKKIAMGHRPDDHEEELQQRI